MGWEERRWTFSDKLVLGICEAVQGESILNRVSGMGRGTDQNSLDFFFYRSVGRWVAQNRHDFTPWVHTKVKFLLVQ